MSKSIYSEDFPYLLFSEEEFNQAKSKDLLTCRCTKCGEEFKKSKSLIKVDIKKHKINQFCSHKCSDLFRRKSLVLTTPHICKFCGGDFTILPSKYASGDFCSKDCARKYSSSFGNTEEKKQQKSATVAEYYSKEENKEKLALAVLSSDKCKVRYFGNYGDFSTDEIYNNIMALYDEYNSKDICEKLNISYDTFKLIKKKYNFEENDIFLKPIYHGAIKLCKIILNKKTSITKDDFIQVQSILYNHLTEDELLPFEIKELYNIEYTNFSTCLKSVLKIDTTNIPAHNKQTHHKHHTHKKKDCYPSVLTEKQIYYKNCKFQLDEETKKRIKGYELIEQYGMYNSMTNLNGVSKDHMLSINYGWTHNIPPEIISHPANCEFMLQRKNASKNKKCSITLEELQERIKNW